MRLVCPNCDAEYEVDGSLIPAEGRDVQCSNCNNTWFQKPDQPEEPLDLTPPAAAAGLTQRPATDPAALDIIHEEVARETRAREADGSALETQTDLGLDESEAGASATRDREARRQEVATEDMTAREVDEAELVPAPRRGEATKRELLPDIEEINSTLASAPDPVYEDDDEQTVARKKPRRRSGFRMGFGLMLMVTAAALALYAYAPALAEQFPATSGALMTYISVIDSWRVALDAGAQWLLEKVTALTEQVGS